MTTTQIVLAGLGALIVILSIVAIFDLLPSLRIAGSRSQVATPGIVFTIASQPGSRASIARSISNRASHERESPYTSTRRGSVCAEAGPTPHRPSPVAQSTTRRAVTASTTGYIGEIRT